MLIAIDDNSYILQIFRLLWGANPLNSIGTCFIRSAYFECVNEPIMYNTHSLAEFSWSSQQLSTLQLHSYIHRISPLKFTSDRNGVGITISTLIKVFSSIYFFHSILNLCTCVVISLSNVLIFSSPSPFKFVSTMYHLKLYSSFIFYSIHCPIISLLHTVLIKYM